MNGLRRAYVFIMFLAMSGYASAHEWIPTYPKLEMSHIPNVFTTQMRLFNTRSDVAYYKIQVFDAEWEKVPFALSTTTVATHTVHVPFQSRKKIDIYIRSTESSRAVYVCSKSRPLKVAVTKTMLYSRICSKIK
jgi:hypothetical protein